MMLEVCAFPKPGNVDRCHDYPETCLEHFLASAILARPALEEAEQGTGRIGEIFRRAVLLTNVHTGGNTHFGAFLLLIPLVYGRDIAGARQAVGKSDGSDAVAFFKAFAVTSVRVLPDDDLDVNDPATLAAIREKDMTLLDLMEHSAARDMVAREWINGFAMTRKAADLLHQSGKGRAAIVQTFLALLASEPDTFIQKKFGPGIAQEIMLAARDVLDGNRTVEDLDAECIERDINPGSMADIMVAGIYVALGEGWSWES
jgi:triphosphoribosyl-dephospho-CoA synthase